MIAQLGNEDCICGRTVNDAVFIVDAARPVTGKSMFKRLGFA